MAEVQVIKFIWVNQLENLRMRTKKDITFGKAIVPFCPQKDAWIGIGGLQMRRGIDAKQYARKLNDLLSRIK